MGTARLYLFSTANGILIKWKPSFLSVFSEGKRVVGKSKPECVLLFLHQAISIWLFLSADGNQD